MNPRRDHPGLLGPRGEIGWKKHVAGKVARTQLLLRGSLRHRRCRDRLQALELGSDRTAQRSLIQIDDAHHRDGTATAKEVAEQPQNDEWCTEEQHEGPAIVAELL